LLSPASCPRHAPGGIGFWGARRVLLHALDGSAADLRLPMWHGPRADQGVIAVEGVAVW
jgi:hypothetical protein